MTMESDINDFLDGCATPCAGDVDGSGSVDVDDVLAVIAGFGTDYDVNDLLDVLAAFGSEC